MLEIKHGTVVVGDLGGLNAVLPTVEKLQWHLPHLRIQWIVDCHPLALAAGELKKLGIEYEVRDPRDDEETDFILAGTSATAAGAQVKWTRWAQGKGVPVVWQRDWYGTGERTSVLEVTPDLMLELDEVSAAMALKKRPGLRYKIVGSEKYGKVPAPEDIFTIRHRVREMLHVGPLDFLVTCGFGGDPVFRAPFQLGRILESKIFHAGSVMLAWRFHPKHPNAAQLAEAAYGEKDVLMVSESAGVSLEQLYYASDLVVADWGGTDSLSAVLAGIPIATMLFPDDTKVREDVGYPDGVPPILLGDPQWGVRSTGELGRMLTMVMENHQEALQRTLAQRATVFESLREPGAANHSAQAILAELGL